MTDALDKTWLPIAVVDVPIPWVFAPPKFAESEPHGGTTYVDAADITRPVYTAQIVEVVELEFGSWTFAVVSDVDKERGIVYLNLRFDTMRPAVRGALWLAQLRLWYDRQEETVAA